jgi:hypothetical protein
MKKLSHGKMMARIQEFELTLLLLLMLDSLKFCVENFTYLLCRLREEPDGSPDVPFSTATEILKWIEVTPFSLTI